MFFFISSWEFVCYFIFLGFDLENREGCVLDISFLVNFVINFIGLGGEFGELGFKFDS